MMITSSALLASNPDPSELQIRQAISGNLCRCTGYVNIIKSVQHAAGRAPAACRSRAGGEIRGYSHGDDDIANESGSLRPWATR